MGDDNWQSWNPVTGCTKISAGCVNCYAERIANKVKKVNPEGKYRNGFKLTLHPEYLDVPLKFKNPKVFFVNSMSDLFHKDVPFEFISRVFNRMERAYWHSYRILTKRPERMRQFINEIYQKPMPNLWVGTSIEDYRVNHRIDELKNTNVKVKFVNFAPLIGPVGEINLEGIEWAYIGGERCFNPRPMKKEWVLEIAEQCKKQNVPCYVSPGEDFSKKNEKPEEIGASIEYPEAYPQKTIMDYA